MGYVPVYGYVYVMADAFVGRKQRIPVELNGRISERISPASYSSTTHKLQICCCVSL